MAWAAPVHVGTALARSLIADGCQHKAPPLVLCICGSAALTRGWLASCWVQDGKILGCQATGVVPGVEKRVDVVAMCMQVGWAAGSVSTACFPCSVSTGWKWSYSVVEKEVWSKGSVSIVARPWWLNMQRRVFGDCAK